MIRVLCLLLMLVASPAFAQSIITQGDSITARIDSWPSRLGAACLVNIAVPGTGFTLGGGDNVIARAVLADPHHATHRLYIFAGTNDIAVGVKATEVFPKFEQWLAERIAAGWTYDQIYVLTMLPRGGLFQNGETTAMFEIRRANYNAMLVNDAAAKGYHLVRLDLNANIGLAGAQNNTAYYQSDKVHLTIAGQNVIAAEVLAAD
jgi:lysophospholipase L1-like esterase